MIKYHVGKQERDMTADLLRARCTRLGITEVEGIQTLHDSWSCIVHTEYDAALLNEALPRKIAIDEQTLMTILSYADASSNEDWKEAIETIEKALT